MNGSGLMGGSSSLAASNLSLTAGSPGEQEVPDEGISPVQIVLASVVILSTLGDGMSVDRKLFRHLIVTKKAIFACIQGVVQQFILMPIVSLVLAHIFWDRSDPNWKYTALGFVFLGIVPGSDASNTITMMSGGVLELSIFMTIWSTIISFVMTPLWLALLTLAVDIDRGEMDFIAVAIGLVLLLIPLGLGVLITWCFPKIRSIAEKVVSVLTVVTILAAIVLMFIDHADALSQAGWRIHVPACFFFMISSSLGYLISAKVFGNAPAVNRTIFLEVGLQNTTLVYALIEITLRYPSKRDKAIPFPVLYNVWMFFWSGVFCFVFREYKKYNQKKNIADNDPELDRVVLLQRRAEQDGLEDNSNGKEEGQEGDKEMEEGLANNVDPVTRELIKDLRQQENRAAQEEDYRLALAIKQRIAHLEEIAAELVALEAKKRAAVADRDYTTALILKERMEQMRGAASPSTSGGGVVQEEPPSANRSRREDDTTYSPSGMAYSPIRSESGDQIRFRIVSPKSDSELEGTLGSPADKVQSPLVWDSLGVPSPASVSFATSAEGGSPRGEAEPTVVLTPTVEEYPR